MASLRILVPEATVNYVKNPSLRYDTTDWNAQGSTVTRTLARARFGVSSLQVVTNGAAQHEGAYFRVSALDGISDVITVSAYVRGAGRVRIRLDDNAPGGQEYTSQAVQLDDERWTRIDVTGRSHGGDDLRLYVETAESTAAARTFYIDGAQMERKPYPTTYCDGDQENCRWDGIWDDSTSSREANTRAGGRWVELSGPERESDDLYMTTAGGMGVAPMTNNTQDFALQPGGYHQNVKVNMRPITFTFHAKHKNLLRSRPVSLERLHELRQMLIDVVKPDLTGGDEEILFEYTDGHIPLYFRARYDGGLEGDWDVRNENISSFPLRLLAVSPFFLEDSQEAQVLDFQETISQNYMLGRVNGQWNIMNYGFDFTLSTKGLEFGNRGTLYGIGANNSFTTVNNDAAAIDPLLAASDLIKWDGEKWVVDTPFAAKGGADPSVRCFKVHPDGKIYVGGGFTSIGGVAANRIAYWDGSAWNTLGTGLQSTCQDMVVAPNGDLYVAGNFTSAGGVTAYRVARWDGSSWHALGDYAGLNGQAWSIDIDDAGDNLYIGGDFTDENGNPGSGLTRMTRYNTATEKFYAMSAGLDAHVEIVRVSRQGEVYAGGTFAASGTDPMIAIAHWTGGTWESLANSIIRGYNNSNYLQFTIVYDIGFDESDNVIVNGIFDEFGGYNKNIGFALWNGSGWLHPDMVIEGGQATAYGSCNAVNSQGDIYIGVNGASEVKISAINTVSNPGTSNASPVFYIKGPGYLRWIENQTTGKRLYLNLLLDEFEEAEINIGKKTMGSQLRPNLFYALLNGSDFGDFYLAPGDNKLACLMVDDVGAQMSVQFTPQHWSADATGLGESL